MGKGSVISLLFFVFLHTGSSGFTHKAGKLLLNEPPSRQIRDKMDSLYLIGDYSSAIEQNLRLITYYRTNGDLAGEIACNNYMGDFLRAAGNCPVSLEYLYIALDLNEALQDSILLAQTYNHLGATYFETNYPLYLDSSEVYALLSLEIASRLRDEKLVYSDLNILGKVQEGRGKLDSALVFLYQALEIVKQVNPVDEPLVLCNIAGVFFNIGNLTLSKEFGLLAFTQAKELNINTYIRMAASLLERIYILEGNFEEAHHYLRELYTYSRTFLDEKIEERISTMKEQTRQAQEKADIQKELDKRRMIMFFLAIIVLCAVAFIILFAWQKKRLREINKELHRTNATLKNFISVIAHDLKNPFNTIIGFSDLLHTEFNTLTPEERKLAIDNTHKSAVNAYTLLEQLLSWARIHTGSFHIELTLINLADLIEEVVNLQQTSAFLKKQKLGTDVPSELKIMADRNMMLTVFRNLLSNAIKFTPEGGKIEVSASRSGETIRILFKDSGVGISEERISQLFRIDEPYKTTGTDGEKGTGFGLILCKEYLNKNKGSLSVESKKGEGSTFIITLPSS